MTDISELQQEWAQADRHIAEGNGRIARQAEVVRELNRHGHDTTQAQSLLQAMKDAVTAMDTHRQQIVRELTRASDELC
jgi:hydroxypyruvate isomerase